MITVKEIKKIIKAREKETHKAEVGKIIDILENEVDTQIRKSVEDGLNELYLEFCEPHRISPTLTNAKFIKKCLKKRGYKVDIVYSSDEKTIAYIRIRW